VSLFGGVDQYHRFGEDDTQVTLGGAASFSGGATLAAAVTYGIDARVVARQVYDLELGYRLTSWATPMLRYRRSNFPGDVDVDLVSPGIELTWAPYASLVARYYFARVSNAGDGHAGSGRITLYPEAPVSVYVGGAYGRETFLAGTVRQVVEGADVATVSAGIVWRLKDWIGVRLDYAYEDRRGSYVKHGVATSVFFEF
jgi:YaiO family outer membrane protein